MDWLDVLHLFVDSLLFYLQFRYKSRSKILAKELKCLTEERNEIMVSKRTIKFYI